MRVSTLYCFSLFISLSSFAVESAIASTEPPKSTPKTKQSAVRPHAEEHNRWSLGLGQGILFTNQNGAHGGVNYPMTYTTLSFGFFPIDWLEVGLEAGVGITSLAEHGHQGGGTPFGGNGWAFIPVLALESNLYFLGHFYTGGILEFKFASRQSQLTFGGIKLGKEFFISPRFAWGPEAQINLALPRLNPIFTLLLIARTFF